MCIKRLLSPRCRQPTKVPRMPKRKRPNPTLSEELFAIYKSMMTLSKRDEEDLELANEAQETFFRLLKAMCEEVETNEEETRMWPFHLHMSWINMFKAIVTGIKDTYCFRDLASTSPEIRSRMQKPFSVAAKLLSNMIDNFNAEKEYEERSLVAKYIRESVNVIEEATEIYWDEQNVITEIQDVRDLCVKYNDFWDSHRKFLEERYKESHQRVENGVYEQCMDSDSD